MHNPLFRRHLRQPRGRHVCLFALTPSHRPTFLLTYTPPHLSTKPQLLHPLLPVCCGAMGVPFDALYDIGMCTCTRLRSMTTTTITITHVPESKNELEANIQLRLRLRPQIDRGSELPGPSPLPPLLGLQIHLAATTPMPTIFFFLAFLVLSLPPKRGAGWGGARSSAPGETR